MIKLDKTTWRIWFENEILFLKKKSLKLIYLKKGNLKFEKREEGNK